MEIPIEVKKSTTDDELVEFGKTQASRWLRPCLFNY
jgi:hypothetical protein